MKISKKIKSGSERERELQKICKKLNKKKKYVNIKEV